MIVFYTRYHVVDDFNIGAMLNFAFNCVNGMKNAPDIFKNIIWDGNDSGEWKTEKNLLSFEIDSESRVAAFRVAIVDENDELWTTDLVLNELKKEIQMRLAREKRIATAEYDRNFNIPYMFKKIVRDGIGSMDDELPVTDTPIYIDDNNVSIVADLVSGKRPYSLPVIYVSHPFSENDYSLDVKELAKDMAGSAHVLVEKTSDTSIRLKELTDSKNAYNGAIDIFYNDDSFRYMRWEDITPNQYRYKISHAVYARMAMRNIDEDISLSALKIRNRIKKLDANNVETQKLFLEVEELKEKRKEDTEFIELLSEEIKNLEKRVNDLENENFDLKSKISGLTEALNRKNGVVGKAISLSYSEEQYYDDEIKRIVLECIRQTVSTYGDEQQLRRDYHILKSILDNNSTSDIGDRIKSEMMKIIKKNNLSRQDVNALKGLGFEILKGSHDKYLFHNDDRYIITVSNSPSDHRDGENLAHEAVKLIFGRS